MTGRTPVSCPRAATSCTGGCASTPGRRPAGGPRPPGYGSAGCRPSSRMPCWSPSCPSAAGSRRSSSTPPARSSSTSGGKQPVVSALRRLLADLDAAVGRTLPPRLAQAVAASTARDADLLQHHLLRPVLGRLGDRPLVVVPTGMLFAVPWGVLPATRGRAVTVAPSATGWVRARRKPAVTRPGSPGALLVSGPRLTHGAAEVERLGAHVPGPHRAHRRRRDRRADPPGAATRRPGAPGHPRPPRRRQRAVQRARAGRRSAARLRGAAPPPRPRVVVLSACDVGRHDVRPGDESLGVTTAFLGAGAATVVASVTRVADAGAPEVMTAFHEGLRGRPAVRRTPSPRRRRAPASSVRRRLRRARPLPMTPAAPCGGRLGDAPGRGRGRPVPGSTVPSRPTLSDAEPEGLQAMVAGWFELAQLFNVSRSTTARRWSRSWPACSAIAATRRAARLVGRARRQAGGRRPVHLRRRALVQPSATGRPVR